MEQSSLEAEDLGNSHIYSNYIVTLELLWYINEDRTKELNEMKKYSEFNDWLKENGVLHPGV
jgi:hypothetical protein